MLMRIFIVLFSSAFACIIVAMAIEGAQNTLTIFRMAHIVVLFGIILAFPSIIYGYLRGSILWENGVRTLKPYLKTAAITCVINGLVWGIVLGVPFMEGGLWIFTLLLGAFILGGVVAATVAFTLMQTLEGKPVKTEK